MTEIPLPATRPAEDAQTPPGPAPDDPATAAPEPEPAAPKTPEAAYVSPDKARTVPEPSAPEVPEAAVTPEQSVEAAEAVLDAQECEAELKKRGLEFTVGPSIADGSCGVLRPISVSRLSSGVTVAPATQMLCRTALALDIWMSEGVVPAIAKDMPGEELAAITHASTYVCRDRASEARISEHSRGSAIDLAGLEMKSGKMVDVEKQAPGSADDRFLADIRRAACGPFRTVLGPGTDADHDTHFHLDIAARSNGSTYCR